MDFAILGPLEVRDRGRPVAVPGAKQRTLLALLLLDANRVVSRDRLIEAMWAGEPPETAAKALQVHVSQLRKTLAATGATGPIVTRPPGYLIELDRDRLDLDRFERLVEEARSSGDAATAAERLREALSLWRGPPLADVAGEAALHAEVERLQERRLAALEDRVDADLALGRHAELVAELEAHVAAHPLRERLRSQLMLALYRAGRQAEALEAYQETRRMLIDELGIEPSPALQRLEQAILRQDPSLEPARAEPPAAQREPLPPHERKLVTVLFADVVDSTGVAAGDPERAHALMTRFFDAVAAEIELSGGTVEKFIGDAVMAAFGAPAAHEDHAERALHAALAMRGRVAELFERTLAVRVGVNTGEVVAAPARAGGSFVTGETVNVAARLEQTAAPGEILVGERTATAVGDAFEFGDATLVDAKGLRDGVRCRALLGARALTRARGVRGLRAAFVGRGNELDLLLATYRRVVTERTPHMVAVAGDAGVGKTRLMQELWRLLDTESPLPLRRVGRCLAYGRGVTYAPLAEILRAQLGLIGSDNAADVRRRLGEREILALTLGIEPTTDLHPLVARERLHEAWIELCEELALEQPLVVALEDLHWAEAPLLELIERLRRDVRGPLLLLASTRPELLDAQPGWSSGRNSTVLWLEALAAQDEERLLAELLGSAPPQALRELVQGRAEGNPFFLEEVLATLIDGGVLERTNGGWALADLPDSFVVPDTVRAALAARIDLLPPAVKSALQAASVIGRVFWDAPIAELLGGGEPDLRLLEERDFVRRRSGSTLAGAREFAFKHALTREVAYETLTKSRRARLHAAFAEWLERVGEGRDEDAPTLAHHYAEAVRPQDADLVWADDETELERLRERALAWITRAAALAAGRYAVDEQIALLESAVEIEERPPDRAALWHAIGRAYAVKFVRPKFRDAMEHALELYPGAAAKAEVLSELAFEYSERFSHAEDRPLIERWVEQALALAPSRSRARARALIARTYLVEGPTEDVAAEAAEVADAAGDAVLQSWAFYVRGDAALARGDYDDAQQWVERRLEVLEQVDDPDHRTDALWSMVPVYAGRNRFDEARRIAALQDELAQELTPHHRMHGIGCVLEVEELAGGWQRVRELTPRTAHTVDATTTPCVHKPRALLVCALGAACLGDDAEAQRLEELAASLGEEGWGRLWETQARLALVRRDLDTLERLLEEESRRTEKTMLRIRKLAPPAARLDALAALGRRDEVEEAAPPLLRRGTYLEPFALRALGAVRGEHALVEQARERFAAAGLEWHAAQTRGLL